MRYLLFLSIFFVSLYSKQNVTWLALDFPPYMIEFGEKEGEGIDDILTQRAIDLTSEKYDNSIQFTGVYKMYELLKLDELYCTAALLKTKQREKFLHFSNPVSINLSHRLYVHKDSIYKVKPFIDENGYIDLEALLKQKDFTLGLTKFRRYSKAIDKIVIGNKNVYERAGEDLGVGILKMLIANRGIDATIAYPIEVDFLAKETKMPFDKLLLPIYIKNNRPFIQGYISCSKNESGKAFIDLVNEDIRDLRISAYAARTLWHNKENRKKLNKYWQEFINERSK